MSDQPPKRRALDDPAARSDAFDEVIGDTDVAGSLRALQRDARSSRRRDVALALSLVVDLLLSIALGRVAFTARDAVQTATSAKKQATLLCEAGNESRRQQSDALKFLIALSVQAQSVRERSAAELAAAADVLAKIDEYLQQLATPRDCSRLRVVIAPPSPSTTRPTSTTTTTRGGT